MRDQAAELRNLVLRAARETRTEVGSLPRMQWIIGAAPHVGATTLAIALAELLADSGFRIVLVNGRVDNERFAELTGTNRIEPDWLGRRQEIHEIIQVGRAGLQVVGQLGDLQLDSYGNERSNWLHRQLCTLRPYADLVIVETSYSDTLLAKKMIHWASEALVITSPLDRSIMNAYASIKGLSQSASVNQTGVLVNRASNEQQAREAADRLGNSCQRFLESTPEYIGWLPDDPAFRNWLDRPNDDGSLDSNVSIEMLRRVALRFMMEKKKNQTAA